MIDRLAGDEIDSPKGRAPAAARVPGPARPADEAAAPPDAADTEKARVWQLFLRKLAARHPDHPWLKEWGAGK